MKSLTNSHLIYMLLAMALLCASCGRAPEAFPVTASSCQSTNWNQQGYTDGLAGFSNLRLSRFEYECGMLGIQIDREAYAQGFQWGSKSQSLPKYDFDKKDNFGQPKINSFPGNGF